jgi:hypothetical protein
MFKLNSKAVLVVLLSAVPLALLLGGRPSIAQSGASQATAVNPDKPFVAEYYYKAKWGYADEFIALFKKNHYPVLKKQQEQGRILQVSAVQPRFHTTEDGRWDYRVTIVYKNAAIANDDFDGAEIVKQLYPDQATYKKEEQRRFEILEAHWDLPIEDVDLAAPAK